MPTGPNGERRPQSDTSCAVHIMKIATGEIKERRAQPVRQPEPKPAHPPGKKMGRAVRRESSDEDVVLWGAGSRRPFFYER